MPFDSDCEDHAVESSFFDLARGCQHFHSVVKPARRQLRAQRGIALGEPYEHPVPVANRGWSSARKAASGLGRPAHMDVWRGRKAV